MILETFPFSFRMAKGILKDYRVFVWKSKVLQVLLSRTRSSIPNKESLKEGTKEQAQGKVIPFLYFRTLEKKYPIYLKEKRKVYIIFSLLNI